VGRGSESLGFPLEERVRGSFFRGEGYRLEGQGGTTKGGDALKEAARGCLG